jgi:hypothetical protein
VQSVPIRTSFSHLSGTHSALCLCGLPCCRERSRHDVKVLFNKLFLRAIVVVSEAARIVPLQQVGSSSRQSCGIPCLSRFHKMSLVGSLANPRHSIQDCAVSYQPLSIRQSTSATSAGCHLTARRCPKTGYCLFLGFHITFPANSVL